MLGHRTSSREELGAARIQMAGHVARSWALGADDALAAPEPAPVADPLLALHRRSVDRLLAVTARRGCRFGELGLVAGAVMDGGVLRESTVVHHRPGQSVLGLRVGKTVRPTVDGVERLTRAALHELAAQFAERFAY